MAFPTALPNLDLNEGLPRYVEVSPEERILCGQPLVGQRSQHFKFEMLSPLGIVATHHKRMSVSGLSFQGTPPSAATSFPQRVLSESSPQRLRGLGKERAADISRRQHEASLLSINKHLSEG